MSFASVARNAILFGAGNSFVESLVKRYGMNIGASRFVSGETVDDAVQVIRDLNERGFKTNVTLLGEAVSGADEAARAVREYELLAQRLSRERLRVNLAVKLSLLGLDLGEEIALANLTTLLLTASAHAMFVRIDMEASRYVDATVRIFRTLRAEGHDRLGIVLQSYLYRSGQDLEDLLLIQPNVRVVKGAYREAATVAFPRKQDVDANFVKLVERSLTAEGYTAIATHDIRLIEHAISFAEHEGIPTDRFEFQMLYGIRSQLQADLVARGFTVLVATCYGSHWYPFFMRRLAERPANTLFLLRSLRQR